MTVPTSLKYNNEQINGNKMNKPKAEFLKELGF
jgi:hypothetical protein